MPARRSEVARKGILRVILVRAHKKRRVSCRESFTVLREYIIVSRMLIKIWIKRPFWRCLCQK